MSQNTRESLSAFMDGEGDELELRRVLKSLSHDDDAAEAWRRYHLARSMMHREREVDVSIDLSAGIMTRLREEPAPLPEAELASATTKPSGISFARGAGVAAAVSLMVITGVQFLGGGATVPEHEAENLAAAPRGGVQVQPVSLGSAELPMFEPTPFRISGHTGSGGLMNVSEAGASAASTPVSPMSQQGSSTSTSMDIDQMRLLQSYLEQHAQGAASNNADSWMPLLRSSTVTEPLGQR